MPCTKPLVFRIVQQAPACLIEQHTCGQRNCRSPQSLENEFLQTHNCIYQAWPRQPNTQFLTEQLQSIQILWIKWEKSPLSRAWLHFQKEPSQLYKAVLIFTLLYKLFQFSQLHVMALGKRLPQIPGRVSVQAPHASEQAWQSHTDTQMGRAEFSV